MRQTVLFAAAFLACGCAPRFDSRLGVLEQDPHEYMFVQGSRQKTWYSALELKKAALKYLTEEAVEYPWQGRKVIIWVNTDGRSTLATVCFEATMVEKFLTVEIGRDGKVRRHTIALSRCAWGPQPGWGSW
jgi:hypothetical protein